MNLSRGFLACGARVYPENFVAIDKRFIIATTLRVLGFITSAPAERAAPRLAHSTSVQEAFARFSTALGFQEAHLSNSEMAFHRSKSALT